MGNDRYNPEARRALFRVRVQPCCSTASPRFYTRMVIDSSIRLMHRSLSIFNLDPQDFSKRKFNPQSCISNGLYRFMDPLTQGNYPFIMREFVGDHLPRFTEKQSEELEGSFDFIGINYCTASYVYDVPPGSNVNTSCIIVITVAPNNNSLRIDNFFLRMRFLIR